MNFLPRGATEPVKASLVNFAPGDWDAANNWVTLDPEVQSSGVSLMNQDGVITGDMFLVVKAGFNVREVCREVQQQVARALQEMAGMRFLLVTDVISGLIICTDMISCLLH